MEGLRQTKTPVIDMHCHCAGIGAGSDCFVSESLRGSWKYRFYLKGFGLTPAELEDEGDQVSIRLISRLVEEGQTQQSLLPGLGFGQHSSEAWVQTRTAKT